MFVIAPVMCSTRERDPYRRYPSDVITHTDDDEICSIRSFQ